MLSLLPQTGRLHGGAPWWLIRNGLASSVSSGHGPWDAIVVGAGISGAMAADALSAAGRRVLVLDRSFPACGSTAASTALLLYELDTSLMELAVVKGVAAARRIYRLAYEAVLDVGTLVDTLPTRCGFAVRRSLYVASRRAHAAALEEECAARHCAGLDVTYLDAATLAHEHGVDAPAALHSATAAVVDPVQLTLALLRRVVERGGGVRVQTAARRVERTAVGSIVHTDDGAFAAPLVLLATGYEMPEMLLPERTRLTSTFAMVTEPGALPPMLAADTVVWETARPYVYLRGDAEGRVLMGGGDRPFRDTARRDRQLPDAVRRLGRAMRRFDPDWRGPPAFTWAATFGTTRDGLPVIDEVPHHPGLWYVVGLGGNGLTFAMLAARLLREACDGAPSPDLALFRATR